MAEKSTYELLIEELGAALEGVINDIGDPVRSPQTTLYFLRKMGWNLPLNTDLSSKPLAFISGLRSLGDLSAITDYANVIASLRDVISSFDNIGANLGLALPNFNRDFPRQLLDYTIMRHVGYEHPKIHSFLLLIGVFDNTYQVATAAGRISYLQYRINWDKLITFLGNPAGALIDMYRWGQPQYNGKLLIEYLGYILSALDIPHARHSSTDAIATKFQVTEKVLKVPFVDQDIVKAGLEIYPVPTNATANNGGLVIAPYLSGGGDTEIKINDHFTILIKGTLSTSGAAGVEIRPHSAIKVFDTAEPAKLTGKLEVTLRISADRNLVSIGAKDSSRLDIGSIDLTGIAEVTQTSGEFAIEMALKNSRLVIDMSGGDSFIGSLLPAAPIDIPFDVTIGYSTKTGIYFKGSAGIEIQLPLHIDLGAIGIEGLTIALKPADRALPISISTNFKSVLGPLTLLVDNIGLTTNFTFPQNNRGNMGPFDLEFGFKPPNGVGVSVDAGIVKGGGYLFHDFEKGEYAGALQLNIEGFLSLNAIGLITTKMPDGSPGFSLLIIVTTEFMPAFQLGYGFTLIGVGGLLALNRSVLLDPLRDGVRTGAINNIMFPTNVVSNAPRIISDLKAFFPVKEGYFLVGPMAKIGWGTPTLISLSLGLIIQLPDPKIAILGVLKIVLPTEELQLLKIQVNFLGTIDPANQLITFDASLFESHLLQIMTLTGDMAVRLKWGDNPDFILSAGGFHPEYEPTMSMPSMERIGIKILDQENARIRVQTYFALTSNTVQFGARADCYFGLDGFSVSGDLGFDALMQFSPFTFKATASGGFTIDTLFGDASIRIRAQIKGPTPWYVNATGTLEVFGCDFEAGFEHEWGQKNNETLPTIKIAEKVKDEYKKKEVWHTELPSGKTQLISIANPVEEVSGETLVIHPFGTLVLSQKFIPYKLTIDKIGNQKISDVYKVFVSGVMIGNTQATLADVQDNFATAQFRTLTDAEKISIPSFEKLCSGVTASFSQNSADFSMGTSVRRDLSYEQKFIDKDQVKKAATYKTDRFYDLLKGSYIKKSKMSQEYNMQLGVSPKVYVDTKAYELVNAYDNTSLNGLVFNSRIEAEDAMAEIVSKNTALQGQIVLTQKIK